jgi:hypothetical protein
MTHTKLNPIDSAGKEDDQACLVICYNRPDLAKQVIKRVINSKVLYLFCDGPKTSNPIDTELTQKFREIFYEVSNERGSNKNYQTATYIADKNLGPRDGPITAIDWFLKNNLKGCILEEDIIPCQEFLPFYSRCLDTFEQDPQIALITACPGGVKDLKVKDNTDKFAVRSSELFLPWGWATWLDRWEKWELTNPKTLEGILEKTKIKPNGFYALSTKLLFKNELKKLYKNPHYAWSYYIQAKIKEDLNICVMPKTNLLWARLQANPNLEKLNLQEEKYMEKLKYGGILKFFKTIIGVRTRVKTGVKRILNAIKKS